MSRIPKILRQARFNFRTSHLYGKELPKPEVADPSRINRASKYFVEDLSSAIVPATRLHNILENLEFDRTLSDYALMYLQQHGLTALQHLSRGEITYNAFCKVAAKEQAKRVQSAETKRQKEEEAQIQRYEHDRQRVEEVLRKRENSPKYITKIKNQRLRQRFGLDQFIEKKFFARLMGILHRLEGGNRLSDEDILWLTTEGEVYYTKSLQAAFHEREAEFYTIEYKQTSNPWNAVNASCHYRKCSQPEKAHDLLTSIPARCQKAPKLNSAIYTTHGGVMRDLNRLDEALKFGNQAHTLTPKDFRPCTLLGAVNIEIGNYLIGLEWYEKAEVRGASERSIDYDLLGIWRRADNTKREEIKIVLLRKDPERYKWVCNLKAQDYVPASGRKQTVKQY